jgi:RimJ/RimL family protein N-acetyltransferase
MTPDQREPILIERLLDLRLINETLRHPRIYAHISDDFCPAPAEFEAVLEPFVYVGCFRGTEYLGLFMLHPHSVVLWEVHTCLLPSAWGDTALDCTAACAAWIWSHTSCERLITAVPQGNELAARLAERSGMALYGTNPRSFKRGGVLVDQRLYGLSKD